MDKMNFLIAQIKYLRTRYISAMVLQDAVQSSFSNVKVTLDDCAEALQLASDKGIVRVKVDDENVNNIIYVKN